MRQTQSKISSMERRLAARNSRPSSVQRAGGFPSSGDGGVARVTIERLPFLATSTKIHLGVITIQVEAIGANGYAVCLP